MCFTQEYKGFTHENRHFTQNYMILLENSGVSHRNIRVLPMNMAFYIELYDFIEEFRCFTWKYKGFTHENRHFTQNYIILQENSGFSHGIIMDSVMEIGILHRILQVLRIITGFYIELYDLDESSGI